MPVEGWAPAKIGDFAWEPTERAAPDVEVLSVTKHRGFVPSLEYFGKQVFSKDTDSYKLVRRGQFAYATIHLDEGSIDCLTSRDEGIISPMYTVFDVDDRKVDRSFLLELLRTPMMLERYAAIGQGSINRRKSIGFEALASETLMLPPLPEQKKIAAILSSVDEAIQATQAVIDQTRRVKEGLLQDLLTRGLPGHTRFKQTEIGEIPESWEVTTLVELAEPNGLQTGPFGGQLHASDYTEGGVPVIMPKDIVDGKLTDSSVARIPTDLALSGALARHRVREGDVVFGRRGDIGRSALVEASHVGWLCGTGCLRMRPSERVHPPYLIQRLQHGPSVRWLNEHAVGQTMLNLNTTILGELPLSLPPLSEQVEIARRFEDLDTSALSNAEPLAALLVMKSGLLQDLLTGRVRVTP